MADILRLKTTATDAKDVADVAALAGARATIADEQGNLPAAAPEVKHFCARVH